MNIFKNKKTKYYVLSAGHFCADLNQGMLSALIPFFVAAYHFDYTTAASLVMISNILGSFIQPLFGMIADKKSNPNMMILGVMLAGGGMAFTGVIDNFAGISVAVVISGIGVAMFHPQGAQLVNTTSDDDNKATNLGIFSFGGNFGFTLGPLMATAAITLFGLKGTITFLLPSILFGVVTRLAFPPERGTREERLEVEAAAGQDLGEDNWHEFIKLTVLISMRSIIFSGVNTFLVLYLIAEFGKTEALGNGILSVYYAIAAFSSLYGGRLADKIGNRRTVRLSYLILLPSLVLFALIHNFIIAAILLIPMGIGISVCYSPSVLMGQQFLPNRTGLASGVMLGLSVSVGGVVAPLFGKIGDVYGLPTTFAVLAAFAVLPVVLAFMLREPDVK